MNDPLYSPPFGQADLTNCERELIHLAGSIQPHGVLLVVRDDDFRVLQASLNAEQWLGVAHAAVVGAPLSALGGDLADRLAGLRAALTPEELAPFHCTTGHGGLLRQFEGMAHRGQSGTLIVELETAGPAAEDAAAQALLATAVRRFSEAMSIDALADTAVQSIRELTHYDRVMVYRFDADGHGEIVAEARDDRLDTLLGHRYPATDIPQRARAISICSTGCACWSMRATCRSRSSRACCRIPVKSWTCRCATCAACRRCTSSTCAIWG